ncbi:sugar-binding domain-containing protein [Pseudomonas sp. LPH60]|uniref:sugar-binding domain-containing protein n=1 Tax=Pseudomonas sp. LPH60 TaxID=3065906 RepID=UPI0035300409
MVGTSYAPSVTKVGRAPDHRVRGRERKIPAILAALRGRRISGLITDQRTAQQLATL